MKVKTVNKTICAKFDEWIESIDNPELKDKLEKGTILTGGAIASMLLREPVNDFDFYFKDIDTAQAVADYYIAKFLAKQTPKTDGTKPINIYTERAGDRVRIHIKSAGVAGDNNQALYQYFERRSPEAAEDYAEKVLEAKAAKEEKPDYRPVFFSDNAISLSGDVQLIIRFYGMPTEIHANYDFVHATNYWTSWDRQVTLVTEALECLLTKELRYIGSKYPLCSLIRARKFIQRDWAINAGQYLKIAMQISELNLKEFEVLQEQLVGMDVAYFMEILALLKVKDPAKINAAYLTEIIDRIF